MVRKLDSGGSPDNTHLGPAVAQGPDHNHPAVQGQGGAGAVPSSHSGIDVLQSQPSPDVADIALPTDPALGIQARAQATSVKHITRAKAELQTWAERRIAAALAVDAGGDGQTLTLSAQQVLPGRDDDANTLRGLVHSLRQPGEPLAISAVLSALPGKLAHVRPTSSNEMERVYDLSSQLRKFIDQGAAVDSVKAEYLAWAIEHVAAVAGKQIVSTGEQAAMAEHVQPYLERARTELNLSGNQGMRYDDAIASLERQIDATLAADVRQLPDAMVGFFKQDADVRGAAATLARRAEGWQGTLLAVAGDEVLSVNERQQLPRQLDALVTSLYGKGAVQRDDLERLADQLATRNGLIGAGGRIDPGNLATLTPELALVYLERRDYRPSLADATAVQASLGKAVEAYVDALRLAVRAGASKKSAISASEIRALPDSVRVAVEDAGRKFGLAQSDGSIRFHNHGGTPGLFGILKTQAQGYLDEEQQDLPIGLVPFYEAVAPPDPLPEFEPGADLAGLEPGSDLAWILTKLQGATGADGFFAAADRKRMHPRLAALVERYRHAHPGDKVITPNDVIHDLLGDAEYLQDIGPSIAEARRLDARVQKLQPEFEMVGRYLRNVALTHGNRNLSLAEQQMLSDQPRLQQMVQEFRAAQTAGSQVRVTELMWYLLEQEGFEEVADRLRPALSSDLPPVSINEVLALGSGEYRPLLQALLRSADSQTGSPDGKTSAAELQAYLDNPQAADLRFLSSGTLTKLFPGLLGLQVPARMTRKSALAWDMGIQAKVDTLPRGWQRSVAAQADGLGSHGKVDGVLTLHELKALLGDVREGMLMMEESGLRLLGKGKSGRGWQANAQWSDGRIWWLPEQLLDMVRMQVQTAAATEADAPHRLAPRVKPGVTALSDGLKPLRHGYMNVIHSKKYPLPFLVAWTMQSEDVHLRPFVPRHDSFRPDHYLAQDNLKSFDPRVQQSPADYYKSGNDIGHMKFAASSPDLAAMFESFLQSNMSPQPGKNNRTTWQDGELAAKELVKGSFDLTYFTGNAFLKQKADGGYRQMTEAEIAEEALWIGRQASSRGLPSKSKGVAKRIPQPTHLWMVRYIHSVDDPDDVRAEAFLMPNNEKAAKEMGLAGLASGDEAEAKVLKASRRSVDDIEELFGIDFMEHLPDAVEGRVESDDDGQLQVPRHQAIDLLERAAKKGTPGDLAKLLPTGTSITKLLADMRQGRPAPPAINAWLWQELGCKNVPLMWGIVKPEDALSTPP